jgi:hypothetical protein
MKLREDKLQNIKSDLQQEQNMFTVATKSNETAVHGSFGVSQIIAEKSEAFADGEYENEWVFKAISLPANTVADNLNGLTQDIQCQLK